MSRTIRYFGALVAFSAASAVMAQEAAPHCGRDHHAQVDERGDHVMGFDHEKSVHNFRLTPTGGTIEVSATDPADAQTREAIRSHLPHIATMFASGDFEAPMLIHGQVPPGVPTMKRDRAKIRWTYDETPEGGRVIASSTDANDVVAIHEFLRFQIEDHRTGDATEVESEK